MKEIMYFNGKIAFLAIFFLFNIFLNTISFAQPGNVVLEMKKGEKVKNIEEGKKVKIWYNGEKYSGNISSIKADSIFMDTLEFKIKEIEKIGIKFKGTIITGSIVGTVGLIFATFGTVAIISGYNSNSLGGAFVVLFGVVIDAVSVPVIIIGTTVATIGKKYKIEKGWEFKAVQLY